MPKIQYQPRPPYPENSPGDFYVESGCCTLCGIPESIAPGIFAYVGGSEPTHCVVARQPRTAAEVEHTLEAMNASEMECIRYRGADPRIGRRLVHMGGARDGELCDVPVSDWPQLQEHLGCALTLLEQHVTGPTLFADAVTAYEAALAKWEQQAWLPEQTASSHLATCLDEALNALGAALEEFPRERASADWAIVQRHLGRLLGMAGRSADAIPAFHAALRILDGERGSDNWDKKPSYSEVEWQELRRVRGVAATYSATEDQWIETMDDLASALFALGKLRKDRERLTEAVTAYKAVLKEWRRKYPQHYWGTRIQGRLGIALAWLGWLEVGTARLEEALANLDAAMVESTVNNAWYSDKDVLHKSIDWVRTELARRVSAAPGVSGTGRESAGSAG